MAFLISPCAEKCHELEIGKYQHVPVIWSADWRLAEEALDYLMQLGAGNWTRRRKESASDYALHSRLSASSMLSYGRDLENFITYCERAKLDWREMSPTDLEDTYQNQMETGSYSSRGRPLSAGTVRRRTDIAVDFLVFAACRGLRPPFERDGLLSLDQASPDLGQPRAPNTSPVRTHPEGLRLPSRRELAEWDAGIRAAHPGLVGITASLMCRTILGTGMRASELLLFRRDQLPEESGSAEEEKVEIMYGTKGQRIPGDPELRGKRRWIEMDRALCAELQTYCKIGREIALRTFRRKHPGQPDPRELFLSPVTGKRYSYRRLHDFWVDGSAVPFAGWSPHCGRHA
ncbi:site-specific integrase [Mangrovicoccus ximenensis]|uniref:site-specific integrase n=1 Tax=Mangrovicoccus ximenensis TaxID=1911570 RepID=UPI000D38A705|nr:site-specific integrase [Mangrovicoccus ximenensis]